jgi:hypothetical protein
MKTARRLCLTAAFAVTLMGQAPPRDVDGWGKIKWGMTIADVSRVYEIDRHEENDFWIQLIAQPVDIGDITMKVSFGAKHGSDQISKVRLWMNFGLKDSAPSASAKDFDTLKTLLLQKYGSPIDGDTRTEGTDRVRTFLWTFPSTSILLTQTQGQNGTGRIDLDYTAIDKKALDAL